MINTYVKWKTFAQRTVTESDGNPSNKRIIATFAVIVYAAILLLAFLYAFPLTDAVIHMADVLLGSAMGTYVVGRFAEKGSYIAPIEEPERHKKHIQKPAEVSGDVSEVSEEETQDDSESNEEDDKK